MKKRKIRSNSVVYGINTGIKYIYADGTNKNYVYVQHRHEDYEIRVITKGNGNCSIGEQVVEYQTGDIFFIGRNVPHCSTLYEATHETELTESGILQFQSGLLPVGIKESPDFIHINKLLEKGQSGIQFRNEKLYKKTIQIVENIDTITGVQKVNELFRLLEMLGRSKYFQLISNDTFEVQNNIQTTDDSLQKVYDYLHNHMKEEITLEQVTEHIHLNPTALCRSFKRKTGVTIFQFLNKIRIENVCRLLTYTDMNISQIAYESGFNNMPHFNRQFKQITGFSPSEYRNRISKNK